MAAVIFAAIFLVALVVLAAGLSAAMSRGRGRGSTPGAGAAGAVYDMLNEDKRRALEIVVEGRAGYTDPETADDKPPDSSVEAAAARLLRNDRAKTADGAAPKTQQRDRRIPEPADAGRDRE